jgi:hypothetical protein
METTNSEFARFDAIVRKVFSVPHDEIVKREKAYQRKRKLAKQKRAKDRKSRKTQAPHGLPSVKSKGRDG